MITLSVGKGYSIDLRSDPLSSAIADPDSVEYSLVNLNNGNLVLDGIWPGGIRFHDGDTGIKYVYQGQVDHWYPQGNLAFTRLKFDSIVINDAHDRKILALAFPLLNVLPYYNGSMTESRFEAYCRSVLRDESMTIRDSERANILVGMNEADMIRGNGGNDRIWGLRGDDTLHGGAGNDTMMGGFGNDSYTTDSSGDSVVESRNRGFDSVSSSLEDYVLDEHVESLILKAGGANGTGNSASNSIIGNALANALAGEGGADVILGRGGNDFLDGGAANDTLAGGTGDDTLTGGGGADSMDGEGGHDTLLWDPDDVLADGGDGTDILRLASGNVDLTAVDDEVVISIECIDLTATGGNTLTLAESDILAMSPTGTVSILGDSADTVDIDGDFTAGAEADGFRTYTVGLATLLIDADITNVV